MKLRPHNDRILLKRDLGEKVTRGGIIIPDAQVNKAVRGTIVAMGPGRISETTGKRVPMPDDLALGVRVLIGDYSGGSSVKALENVDDDLVIVREDEILGVIDAE